MIQLTAAKIKPILPILTIAILSIALFGMTPMHESQAKKKSKEKLKAEPPIAVEMEKVKVDVIPTTISSVGHLKAIQSVQLSFGVDGHIVKIFKQGVRVKAGTPVVKLNDEEPLAQLASLKADLQLSQQTYDRYHKLKQYGNISSIKIDQQKAELAKAKAAVEQQQAALNKLTLNAPFDGILGLAKFNVGAYVATGTPVISLVQQAPLKAVFSVPASEKSHLEIGQSVSVQTSIYPNNTFAGGVVNFISPQVNTLTGTLQIEAKVPNVNYLLSPGMFVTVTQTIDPNTQWLTVPDVAILTDIRGQYVYLALGNKVKKSYVKVARFSHGLALIDKGIKVGDIVVTAGQQKLLPTSRITIIPQLKPKGPLKQEKKNKSNLLKHVLSPLVTSQISQLQLTEKGEAKQV